MLLDYYIRIIAGDLLAMATTVFVEYILFNEKCLRAFLIHLCCFVYISGAGTYPGGPLGLCPPLMSKCIINFCVKKFSLLMICR